MEGTDGDINSPLSRSFSSNYLASGVAEGIVASDFLIETADLIRQLAGRNRSAAKASG